MKTKSVQSFNPYQSVIKTLYDIIKAHDGEIKVNKKESEGTGFVIQLPIT